jgi:hypothetical protein
MNSALEGRLAVGALTLVLAVVLASCSGGGAGGSSAGREPSSTAEATTSGKSTTGALWRRGEVRLLFIRNHYDVEGCLGWDAQDHRYQGD